MSGFTIIEMLIAISIVGIIGSVITFGYQEGADHSKLINAAEGIETTLRQAQVDATSSRAAPPGSESGDRFDRGYGVYFKKNDNKYTLYYGDKVDVGDGTEVLFSGFNRVSDYNLPNNIVVKDICVADDESSLYLGDGECVTSARGGGKLHVLFRRPSLGAIISDTSGKNIRTWEVASIILHSEKDPEQEIKIVVLSSGRFNIVK